MSTEAGAAESRIYALATQHGIVAERLPIDDWADHVARLSDAEVPSDPVDDLVVTLRRKGIITDREATELLSDYFSERNAAKSGSGDQTRPVQERLAKTLAMARELGPFAPIDHKKFTDELWGEED
ncbi:hypothetical protein [Agrobacterium vitis]|uniref:hypothetical protein n=1 Tax=Agrobacterium vitis TaxID=373 RepID=UPI0018D4C3CC|nr:hypothetical protein [Agrobacterium vitis]